ncbi:MAG: hypothetical protein ACK4UJ_02495 [Leptonema sp. (in: bacteria)]
MNLSKCLLCILITFPLFAKEDGSLIQKTKYVTIDWTKGILYSEYSITGNSLNKEQIEKETYEKALHNLYLALYDLFFESGLKIKDKIIKDENFKKIMYKVGDSIRIEKKIQYLNTTTYLLSFPFLEFFDYYFPTVKEYENLEDSYPMPVKKEKNFKGIVIYVNKESFHPSLRVKIYNSTGKLILILPIKKNTIYTKDNFIFKDSNLVNPYLIYTKKNLDQNDIVIDDKDIQFLIGTKNIYKLDSIKIVIYDE